MPTLGEFIKERRAKKQQSQRAAAEKLGVSHQTLIAWERGQLPTADRLPTIADWAGVSLNKLRPYLES